MFKFAMIILSLTIYASSSFAQPDLPVLICNSLEEINGWDGSPTDAKLKYTAYIKSSTELVDAEVTGAYFSDRRDLSIYNESRNYLKFQTLEDAWNWFVLSVPKGFSEITHSFIAYVNVHAEENYGTQNVEMKCFIKQPEKNSPPSSEAMKGLADEIGEYFSQDAVIDFGYNIKLASKTNMPKKLKSLMSELLDENNEAMKPQGEVYAITGYIVRDPNNNQIMGYVITTDERYYNDPRHDGSGITYYLDTDYNSVEEISWAG